MGEFDIDRIVELLDSGEFMWTDLCWHQGMSAWAPLTNLRSEVAAAKAFPPVAGSPSPVVSGRRRSPPPAATPVSAASRSAGWWWVVAGASLGAIVGLLTAHLFPTIVQVDRPVEKIVDRPVEVVRTVEKRVDVPAQLTPAQLEAIDFAQKRDDAYKREIGWGTTAMVPVHDKKIRVFVESQADPNAVSVDAIRARVESVFRRNGFKILAEDDRSDFASTFVIATLKCVDPKDENQISGSLGLSVKQYVFLAGVGIQKRAWVTMGDYGFTLQYGSNNYHKIPELYDDFAVRVANDLLKAGPLPYSK